MNVYSWRFWSHWLALAGWVGVIFWFSSQPDLQSGLETWQDIFLRKLAHLAEYFVLTYLWLRCQGVRRRWPVLAAVSAFTFALFVASADELYQTTVQGRHGTPADVLVDLAGVMVLLWWPGRLQRQPVGRHLASESKNSYTT